MVETARDGGGRKAGEGERDVGEREVADWEGGARECGVGGDEISRSPSAPDISIRISIRIHTHEVGWDMV